MSTWRLLTLMVSYFTSPIPTGTNQSSWYADFQPENLANWSEPQLFSWVIVFPFCADLTLMFSTCVWSFDRLIDWSIVWRLIDWLIDRSIDDWMIDWLNDWLNERIIEWMLGFELFFMAIIFCIIVCSAQRFAEVLQGAAGTWSRWGIFYRASCVWPILFSGFCFLLQDLFQLLKREYASFLCAAEQGYSISLEFDLEKIAALSADAVEEIITKAALLKRNCFSSVFEKYFNFQEKGELGHQRAVIHYREDETMWVPVWQKILVPSI